MEHSLFLRQYKYELPSSLPGAANYKSALSAFFDFEHGDFQLEGDYQVILNANSRDKNYLFKQHIKRVFVEAEMKADIPSGPNDNLSNELLLYLKGSIYIAELRCKCSGLLRLNRNGQNINTPWMIYCNLVDNDMNVFEIKLKLPVFTNFVQTPADN